MPLAKQTLLFLAFLTGGILADEGPKNIILILADDIGIDGIGCYGGSDYKTPVLDGLAKTGVRFSHAYSQPLCTPTRVQIMTGKYNHRNWQYFGILRQGEKTFGHLMSDFGFKTCIAGKWQLTSYDPPDFPGAEKRRGTGTHPKDAGFDEYSLFHAEETEDKGSRYADPTYLQNGVLRTDEGKYGEDMTIDYIADFMKRNREERMFVYYPMALPHWPMVPTPDSEEWKDPSRRFEEDTRYFKDMVEYMDKIVGNLMAKLDELGLREDTMILFYGDNGTDRRITSTLNGKPVQGGKALPIQAGIRVPLIVNWPKSPVSGLVTDDLVDASDFLPTLVDLAGKSLPDDWGLVDGISFAPRLLGKPATPREVAFFWYDPRPGWDKMAYGRHIFALDHSYKLSLLDDKFYDIAGLGLREEPLEFDNLSPEAQQAREKLLATINRYLQPPLSPAALTEVDAYGNPVK
tara:strand:+ start:779 stop:2161 length:1383 start_codon:yes stop_codon:yes gene_type:complete